MALAIQIALWPASRRYKRGTGKFQLLFSVDHQSVGIPGPIVTAMVVVPQVNSCGGTEQDLGEPPSFEWQQVDWQMTC